MKVNTLLTILLVVIGVGVGAFSLYTASLSGVMTKMGLVGGDFGQAVDTNKLARMMMFEKHNVECGMFEVIKSVPAYLLSNGEERVKYARELGGQRIICGIQLIKRGNVERGVYTVVKGLYYLKSYYSEMKNLVEQNRESCKLLAGNLNYDRFVEGYLNATDGRVYNLVLDVYKQVESERARVDELCGD